MSLLGLGAWLMYGVLGVADSVQSSAINSESKERAIKNGDVTYMDAKGNERMISTGQIVMRWCENGETILIDPKTMRTVYNITAAEKRKEREEAPHYYDKLNQMTVDFAKENGYKCATQYFKVVNEKNELELKIKDRDIITGKIIYFDKIFGWDYDTNERTVTDCICYYDSDESYFKQCKISDWKEYGKFQKEHTTKRAISADEAKEYLTGRIKTGFYISDTKGKLKL